MLQAEWEALGVRDSCNTSLAEELVEFIGLDMSSKGSVELTIIRKACTFNFTWGTISKQVMLTKPFQVSLSRSSTFPRLSVSSRVLDRACRKYHWQECIGAWTRVLDRGVLSTRNMSTMKSGSCRQVLDRRVDRSGRITKRRLRKCQPQ